MTWGGRGAGRAAEPVVAGSAGMMALRLAIINGNKLELEQIGTSLTFGRAVRLWQGCTTLTDWDKYLGPQMSRLYVCCRELYGLIQMVPGDFKSGSKRTDQRREFIAAYQLRFTQVYPQTERLAGIIQIKDPTFQHGLTVLRALEKRDAEKRNPLHRALKDRNLTLVKSLVGVGVDLEAIWQDGQIRQTPLQMVLAFDSTSAEREPFVATLLDAGADVYAAPYGAPPVCRALFADSYRSNDRLICPNVQRFLAAGASVKARDPMNNRTALMYATEYRMLAAVRLLLQRGADPDAQDNQGNTALHRAVQSGFKEAETLLLQFKADATISNKDRKTPADLKRPDTT
jgi:hypothetical protein